MSDKIYGTACGHWGDVLCSLPLFKETIGEGNIAYYGDMGEIVTFLEAQDYIHHVFWVKDRSNNFPFWWSQETLGWSDKEIIRDPKHVWTDVFIQNGLDVNSLQRTHLHREWTDGPVKILDNVSLTNGAEEWAQQFRETLPEHFFILNPYSFASTPYHMHWQGWGTLMRELASFTPKPFKWVVVGKDWHPKALKERVDNAYVVDMVDKIPNMMSLLALAKKSSGILTTSNSLAHWGAISNIPTSVMCNSRSSLKHYFFRRVLEHPLVECWDQSSSVMDSYEAISRLFPFP